MTRSKRLLGWLTAGWLFAGVLAWATPAASAPVPPDAPAFGDQVEVRVLNLEIVVNDGNERVTGLSPDDFQLRVDGTRTPIRYFTEVRDGRALRSSSAGIEAVPQLSPGDAVGTRYLVFIDDVFTVAADRNRILQQLDGQLGRLGPNDRVAIVAFDGQRLEMVTSWTRSLAQLNTVLREAERRPAYGLQRQSEQRFYDEARDLYGRRSDNGGSFARKGFLGSGHVGSWSGGPGWRTGSDQEGQLARVTAAAASAMRGFAQPAGRKVMLLLAGEWPIATADRLLGRPGQYRMFRPLVETANRLAYTVYPVDVAGLPLAGDHAERGSLVAAAAASERRADDEELLEDALHFVARETGGRALLDGAGLAALEQVAEDTRSYYWLGFAPGWREDDAHHRIEVRVPRGLTVRARSGFSDLSRQTEMTMLVESAQRFGLPLPGDGLLRIVTGTPEPQRGDRMLLPLELEFSLDQVTLLPSGNGLAAQLELRIAALGDDGEVSPVTVLPVEIRRGVAPTASRRVRYATTVRLRQEEQQLLLALFDPASGNILSARTEVRP